MRREQDHRRQDVSADNFRSTGARVNRASPVAISTNPGSSVFRAPKRMISRSEYLSDRRPHDERRRRKAGPICGAS